MLKHAPQPRRLKDMNRYRNVNVLANVAPRMRLDDFLDRGSWVELLSRRHLGGSCVRGQDAMQQRTAACEADPSRSRRDMTISCVGAELAD
jgi:hypothetical protein